MEGLLSTGPTPSTSDINNLLFKILILDQLAIADFGGKGFSVKRVYPQIFNIWLIPNFANKTKNSLFHDTNLQSASCLY